MKFEELNLKPVLMEQIKRQGFKEMTLIQEKTIPEIRKGKDVVGHSLTGSGKTAAFAIPILEHIVAGKNIQALVLTPTSELCVQVQTVFDILGKAINIRTTPVFGGVGIEPQIDSVRRADVVVATPGRLLDLIQRRAIRLDTVKFFVLDEVDKMFEMGFVEDVERITTYLPTNRQTLLFSATMSPKVHQVIKKHLKNPVMFKAQIAVDKSLLKQNYYVVDQREKFGLLVHLIKQTAEGLSIIFCATRSEVDIVAQNLKSNKIHSMAIHGGLTQNKRLYALESLRKEHVSVLVATDVAARGLDIKNVHYVYNYDVPRTSEEYMHRIGRTARAGEKGEAITLLSQKDYDNFSHVLSDRTIIINKLPIPQFEKIMMQRIMEKRPFGSRASGPQGHSGPRSGGPRFGSRPDHRGPRSDAPRDGSEHKQHEGSRYNGSRNEGRGNNESRGNSSRDERSDSGRSHFGSRPSRSGPPRRGNRPRFGA